MTEPRSNTAQARAHMVAAHIAARGVRDPRVLEAMATVPREHFVPAPSSHLAYADSPLPIGEGQTISQPYIVALMAEAAQMKASDRVLEVGTGSGYAAAVFSLLAKEVHTVERHGNLAARAAEACRALGCHHVHVHVGDGTLGWPEAAPFDAILVAAGGPVVPPTLLSQLAPGGRLVIPVGDEQRTQRLLRVTRGVDDPSSFHREDLGGVMFVPLIGEGGWRDEGPAPRG